MKQISVVAAIAIIISLTTTTMIFVGAYNKPDNYGNKDPSQIQYELGGLLVTNSFECLDHMKSCKEQVDDDPEACEDEDDEVYKLCPASCGICQKTDKQRADKRMTIGVKQKNDGTTGERHGVDKVLQEMINYLKVEVMAKDGYANMYQECQNKHELCAFWAARGECQSNPNFMNGDCMLACKTCDRHPKFVRILKSRNSEL